MNFDYLQPVVIPPDSGKVLNFLGITHKLTHQQTGGGYYLFEFAFDPESGNGLHVHSYEDEVVYVLEGAIQIRLGNEWIGCFRWRSRLQIFTRLASLCKT